MINRLFVYGTLAPGKPNEHVLANISGSWKSARVRGHLYDKGWGAAKGFPGIVLDENADWVEGQVFSSRELSAHWKRLDDFEGAGYRRVVTFALTKDGESLETYIYELSEKVN